MAGNNNYLFNKLFQMEIQSFGFIQMCQNEATGIPAFHFDTFPPYYINIIP